MKTSRQQLKQLKNALINAFPNKSSLEMLLYFDLEKNLNEITRESDLQEIVFKLIQTAESQGWLENLVRAACEENPGNPLLKEIAQELLTQKIPQTPLSNIPQEANNQQQKILLLAALPQNLRLDMDTELINRNHDVSSEDLGNGISLEMVAIPSGQFLMGSPASEAGSRETERPQHKVMVKAFNMGKYQITQAQWRVVAALPKVNYDLKTDPSYFKGDNHPVENISWYDAAEFCDRLTRQTGKPYRLPSEAEWEYACRAGMTTPFHFGETITTDLANYNGDYTYASGSKGVYRTQTTDVGSFPLNAFGLYDMHGNVWEWCEDTWHDNYQGAPTNGSAWLNKNTSQSKVMRGGSWSGEPGDCRSVCRHASLAVSNYNDNIGFRVVCGLSPRTTSP